MTNVDSVALLLVRLVIGVVMVAHGRNHWLGGGRIAGTARWFSGLGLRYGTEPEQFRQAKLIIAWGIVFHYMIAFFFTRPTNMISPTNA